MIATIDYTDSPYSTVLVNKDLRTLIFQKLIEKYKILLPTPLGKKINVEPKALKSFLEGSKIEVHDIVFKFYSLIPSYLRNKRKIRTSNTLTEGQKSELLKGV